jgi:hypothetical protein
MGRSSSSRGQNGVPILPSLPVISRNDSGPTAGISGGAQLRPLHATVRRMTSCQTGLMFWLWWKTFSGSYVVFTSTSRL